MLGEKLPLDDFTFIGGLSEVGDDSAELLIGDNDGICCGFMLNVFGGFGCGGGGDGVIDRDSVSLVYLSETTWNQLKYIIHVSNAYYY